MVMTQWYVEILNTFYCYMTEQCFYIKLIFSMHRRKYGVSIICLQVVSMYSYIVKN
jgi:hypothetical protein